ncbi:MULTISPECIES: sugar ABC transporter permease [Aminobacter]|uniref:Xylose transport system permease protein XylH n=2 Tax=Aminobacter TaxID=31988 RepID=A0AAC9AR11_AMIAI|nr:MULTISPECIES: sugar ABC transporter permease [Aminobacter]AMS40531.1 sugar ABC transporter permease [Aminobacter aminovorans]MBA8905735.1 D-xylose transport system permease protein [Aminobacter ciceronei]MBA9019514.1 D-xylose transport system permease protein [Aminobacter ciceronei]MBB3706535.1 D-xylose transport system permease protein [Aminobacter aminovorans]BBD39881.1 sugar ABC transporter permease [Aminobacter sp. SS-2016]
MTDTTTNAPADRARTTELGPVGRFLKATEIDTRMLGMVGALLLIWVGLQVISSLRLGVNPFEFDSRTFLTARNLWNLSVQASAVAIMATGMVLVIVMRNIDLSVGSAEGLIGMVMGFAQVHFLVKAVGLELGNPWIWALALAIGIALGLMIGALQGFVIAYMEVPAFIVTLGGLLIWRGAAWWVTSGQTIAPLDATFQLMGGGPQGAIGATWSWIVGLVACLAVVFLLLRGRQQRKRFKFPLRPVWAEALLGAVTCGVILGAIWIANSYPWPIGIVRRYAEANGITIPEGGLFIAHGIAIPVLIAVAVGIVMTFVTNRTRFGRYVFAIGGNPEAANLAGINTRWITMKVFMIMGVLAAISAAVSSARLNSATNSLGTLDELLVIAAAVIGGTSLAGGSGTVAGAMLGALLMQSLQSGMVLLNIDTPLQNIVVGLVLVVAVWLDTLYRKRV